MEQTAAIELLRSLRSYLLLPLRWDMREKNSLSTPRFIRMKEMTEGFQPGHSAFFRFSFACCISFLGFISFHQPIGIKDLRYTMFGFSKRGRGLICPGLHNSRCLLGL